MIRSQLFIFYDIKISKFQILGHMFPCLDHLSIRFIYKCIHILVGCFYSDDVCIVKVKIVLHINV